MTPYNLAVKWRHPDSVLRVILRAMPALDTYTHTRVNYGIIVAFFCSLCRASHRKQCLHSELAYLDEEEDSSIRQSVSEVERSPRFDVEYGGAARTRNLSGEHPDGRPPRRLSYEAHLSGDNEILTPADGLYADGSFSHE